MSERNYWLSIFNIKTWQQFLSFGGNTAGFSEVRWSVVQQLRQGDYLLCYLTGISRWVGILEVKSEAFIDKTPIWGRGVYPCRIEVRQVLTLTPETAVPVLDMKDQLTVFQGLANPKIWSVSFRASPFKWKLEDGKAVFNAIQEATKNPVVRPITRKTSAKHQNV